MKYPPSWIVLAAITSGSSILADDLKDEAGAVPSVELLEFLGEWETDNGEWVDPELLDNDDFADLLRLTKEEAGKDE